MKRREFSRAQKAAIVLRSTNAAGRPCCEGCGLVLKRGDGEVDHTIPEALIADKTRPLTIEDGKFLGKSCCHRGAEGKTATDVTTIAKVYRVEAKHLGTAKKRSTWPGCRGSKYKKRLDGTTELRRET